MQIPYAVLFALLFSIPTLAAPVAMAPGDELILEARKAKAVAKKPVVKAKPVAKPKAAPKPAPKPVAKPAPKPVAKKPVPVKAAPKPVAVKPVAKKPVAVKPVAKKPVAVKPVAKPVAVKPAAIKPVAAPAKKPVAVKPVANKPVLACPLPKKKTTARRFLEFVGLAERSDPSASCPPLSPTAAPPAPAVDPKVAAKAAKAKAKADKAAAAQAKADAKAKAAADAEAAKRKVGPVANAPTKAVQCTNKDGALTEIPLAAIKTALTLAQQGPLVGGKNPVKFPHVFNNREAVKVDSACIGKVLEEQAVGPDMSTFQNIPSVLGNFNQFRVVITTPDATTGATTFCGVMTHGTSTTGTFEKDLCAEV